MTPLRERLLNDPSVWRWLGLIVLRASPAIRRVPLESAKADCVQL